MNYEFRYAGKIMAIVMAGGQGVRLHPLTDKRSRPAVPSGSRYRIMDFTRISRGARLRRTIVDRHNLVERDACIGFDPTEDATRYEVSPNGIVVVPRGRPPYFARDSRSPGMGYSE